MNGLEKSIMGKVGQFGAALPYEDQGLVVDLYIQHITGKSVITIFDEPKADQLGFVSGLIKTFPHLLVEEEKSYLLERAGSDTYPPIASTIIDALSREQYNLQNPEMPLARLAAANLTLLMYAVHGIKSEVSIR